MDAAEKNHTKIRLFLVIALALVAAAPGWAQTFSLSATNVNFNQSVTGADISVGSTGDPITFTTATSYASDGGNGAWLRVNQVGSSTPSTVQLNVASVAGLPAGSYTATVTLTSSAPAGIS